MAVQLPLPLVFAKPATVTAPGPLPDGAVKMLAKAGVVLAPVKTKVPLPARSVELAPEVTRTHDVLLSAVTVSVSGAPCLA